LPDHTASRDICNTGLGEDSVLSKGDASCRR
jgi:hypothetical protein